VDGGTLITEDIPRWTQHGYAVLEPDIQPRVDDGGEAALEAVTAAIGAAASTGVVDIDRLGLEGHSYGAYETFFVVTQTDMFKAAVPIAGVTDLLSQYGSVFRGFPPNLQFPGSFIDESGQLYLGGPWWTRWAVFVRNSPLFHIGSVNTPLLIIHGDDDSAAPFSQSVEFFNSLRRIGGKSAVLLQYSGEDHMLHRPQTVRDLAQRKLEFFDHFVRGGPQPSWWTGP
jgi:dipeptidyl aminopeptidase/acylaminoacyl peptidase